MGRIQAIEEVETPNVAKTVTPHPPKKSEIQQPPSLQCPEIVEPAVSFLLSSDIGQLPSLGSNSMAEQVTSNLPHSQLGQSPYVGRTWSTGLFDFHLNQTNAIMTAFLPCVTFGQIAEVLDHGETTCELGTFMYLAMLPAFCSFWIIGSNYRKKLRKRFGLVEAPYQDFVSHIIFPFCSLCQEFRELHYMGFDPALGWNGILAHQQKAMQNRNEQIIKEPPPVQEMSK